MNARKKDGQISVEYMMIIGFVTVITIPLIIIYYNFIQESDAEITSTQISQIARKIVDAAESVYYLGEPSQTTLRINIPNGIVSANLSSGKEVVFRVRSGIRESDIVQTTSVNISGSLPAKKGAYAVTIKAMPDYVNASYK